MSNVQLKLEEMYGEMYSAFEKEMWKIMKGDVKFHDVINFHDAQPSFSCIPVWKIDDLSQIQKKFVLEEIMYHFATTLMTKFPPESLRWLLEPQNIDDFIEVLSNNEHYKYYYIYDKISLLSPIPSNVEMVDIEQFYVDYQLPYGITTEQKHKFNFWDTIIRVEGIYTLLRHLFRERYCKDVGGYLERFIISQS
jgi:hypothetical protein